MTRKLRELARDIGRGWIVILAGIIAIVSLLLLLERAL